MLIDKHIAGIRNNELDSYKIVYDMYSAEMYASSFRITNNMEESKDILQESFLKSFSEIEKLRVNANYGAWLKRIVINQSLQYLRKKKIEPIEIPEDLVVYDEEEYWYSEISIAKIKEEIQNLPDKCRAVFSLYVFEDLKHREIASQLGISNSTSKSQYAYACKLLREKLTKKVYNEI